jgi:hypothetical protein
MHRGDPRFAGVLTDAAARRLGVDVGLAPEAERAWLFDRLRTLDFLPDPATHDAIKVRCGHVLDSGPLVIETRLNDEEFFQGQIESFAEEFFDLPPHERCARWESLTAACALYPTLAERLRHFRPGLEVDREGFFDKSPAVSRLAEDIFALFVLRPSARAARARALASRLKADRELSARALKYAARRLRKRHAEIAALAVDYLDRLEGGRYSRGLGSLNYRLRGTPIRGIAKNPKANAVAGVLVALYLVVNFVFRGGENDRRRTVQPRGFLPTQGRPINPPMLPTSLQTVSSERHLQFFRDQFKEPLKRELTRRGRMLDDLKLQAVINHLPADIARRPGGLTLRIVTGEWTQDDHDRCVAALARGLRRSGIDLTPTQMEEVAQATVPNAPPGSRRAPSATKGAPTTP